MQLLVLFSILATAWAATDVNKTPYPSASAAPTPSPNPSATNGTTYYTAKGYATSDCSGDPIWTFSPGTDRSGCVDIGPTAKSMRWTTSSGNIVRYWNNPNFCHDMAFPPLQGHKLFQFTVPNEGTGCVTADVAGFYIGPYKDSVVTTKP